MKLVDEINYDEVDFKYIKSHYDLHLKGTCIHNGKLHKFITAFDYEEPEYPIKCRIYSLTQKEIKREELSQWLFEICVGYHNTYIDGSMKKPFYIRSPEWIYNFLFRFYYNSKIIKPLLLKLLMRVKNEN